MEPARDDALELALDGGLLPPVKLVLEVERLPCLRELLLPAGERPVRMITVTSGVESDGCSNE